MRRLTSQAKSTKLLSLAVALCHLFIYSATAEAQYAYNGLKIAISKNFGEKWEIVGLANGGRGFGRQDYTSCGISLGASYRISNDARLYVFAQGQYADYMHIPNKDMEMCIKEMISWRRASGFFFGFYFEQKRLFYKPYDYAQNVSCFCGFTGYEHMWVKTGIYGRVRAQAILNMTSPNTKASFIQRAKVTISALKKINNRLFAGLDYTYGHWGEKQVYIADRDNLHNFGICVSYRFGEHRN